MEQQLINERMIKIEKLYNKLKNKGLIKNNLNNINNNIEINLMIKEDIRYCYLKKQLKYRELKNILLNLNYLNKNTKNDYLFKLLIEINKIIKKYPIFLKKNYKPYLNFYSNLKKTEIFIRKKLNELKIIVYNDKINFKLINYSKYFLNIEINFLIQHLYLKFELIDQINNELFKKTNLKSIINNSKEKKSEEKWSDFEELPLAKIKFEKLINNQTNYIKIDKNELKPNNVTHKLQTQSLRSIQILKNNLKKNNESVNNNLEKSLSISKKNKLLKRNTVNFNNKNHNSLKFQKLNKQKTLDNKLINYFNYSKVNNINNYIIKSNTNTKSWRKIASVINNEPMKRFIKLNTYNNIKLDNNDNFLVSKNDVILNLKKDNIKESILEKKLESFDFYYRIEDIKNKKIKILFNPLISEKIPPEKCGYTNSNFEIKNKEKIIKIKVF